MTSDELRYKIQRNYEAISDCYTEISQLQSQIRELETLKQKFYKLQERLSEDQFRRKCKLGSLAVFAGSMKIVKTYTSGMNGLLCGAEFAKAFAGLSGGVERINILIGELSDRIDQANMRIHNLRVQNDMMYCEMRLVNGYY